ncbi:MAG TPA: LysR substrate-binding domain-containing protein [Azospirillum sp.]|nr:LysR substrate-binding domain-containing protein [Azospirillum sp.]
MNITLRQLSYFLAVAETGSISGAAANLGISQSAITESLRALEGQTAATLFTRHARGVTLTYQGHLFLRHTRHILSAVADARRAINSRPEQVSGTLHLGVTSLVAGYMLADLLARFRRVFPNVRVQVFEEERGYIEHLLVNGELDVALMLISNLQNQQALDCEAVVRSPNRVWLPPEHALLQRERITLQDIAGEPIIQLSIDEMAQAARQWWRQPGRAPQVEMTTSSVEAVRSLVATGAGVAILPDIIFRPWSLEGDRIEARQVEGLTATVDIGLAWRKGSPLGEPVRIFRELAREHRLSRGQSA